MTAAAPSLWSDADTWSDGAVWSDDVVSVPAPQPGTGALIATTTAIVTTASVQTATAIGNGIPLGAEKWARPFDPGDHAPYARDFSGVLASGETIADIDLVAMSPAAAALGVTVDQSDGYGPIITDDGKHVQLWFVVADGSQALSSFDANGVQLPVTIRIVTDSTPPKRFERTAVLTVRQL